MPSIKQLWPALAALLLLGGCSGMPTSSGKPAASAKPADSALQRDFEEALFSLREGNLERSLVQFQRLNEENPTLSGPLTNIGIIQLKQDNPKAAEASFRQALERNPESAPAYNQLGVALRMQGRFQEAEAAYQKALELEPVYLMAHRNLGILYDLYLAEPAKALEQYRLCQKLAEAPNQELEGWILELERRVGEGN